MDNSTLSVWKADKKSQHSTKNFYEHNKLRTGDTFPQDPSIRASKEKECVLP